MSNSTFLHLRALNKYQEDGLISLMGAAKNKFKPDIKRIILNSLIMNRDQLTSYAESEESLWHYESETLIFHLQSRVILHRNSNRT
jgi:hypothetical protein